MHSKQGKLCTVSRAKKRPFHTISTHFNTNLTPASQKKTKNHAIHKSLTIKCLLNHA